MNRHMLLIALPELPLKMTYKKAGITKRAKVDAVVRCPDDGVTFTVPFYQEHVSTVALAGYSTDKISAENPVSIELERDSVGNVRLRGVYKSDDEFVLLRDGIGAQRKEAYGL